MKKTLVRMLLLMLFIVGIMGCGKSKGEDESSANLKSIQFNVGKISPKFSKDVDNYTLTVPLDTNKITLTAKGANGDATITGDGEITLTETETKVLISVLSADGTTTKTYTITIIKKEIANDNILIIHYLNDAGIYTDLAVWAWGDGTYGGNITTWPLGEPLVGTDDFGAIFHIPLTSSPKTLGFLIVNTLTENKEMTDMEFSDFSISKEIWVIEGSETIHTSKPDLSFFTSAEFITKNSMLCSSKSDISEDAVIEVFREGVKVDSSEYTITISGKTATILFATEQNISDVYVVTLDGRETIGSIGRTLLNSEEMAYDGDDLGAVLNGDGTVTLKLWTPVASKVEVILFNKDNQNEAVLTEGKLLLEKMEKNIWTIVLNKDNTGISDLEGYFYQYKVVNYGIEKIILDPYAKSMASFDYFGKSNGGDNVGKGAFVDVAKVGPAVSSIGISNLHDKSKGIDMVAYEVHTRDFTIDTDVENPGTFTGFKNFTKGLNHLQDLGITHIQILPVHNFYTVDEKDKTYLTAADADGFETNYNWGYDPHNYFTLEGWYSTNPEDPYSRIKEFKELIAELHSRNIGVIIDVVYNHTFKHTILNDVVPGVYHRPAGKAVPVGDPAVASENPMTRKLIVDSIKLYVEEYGVDGFRFDLMGFMDIETMRAIRKAVGPNIILQGEAWDFTDLPAETKTVKGAYNYPHELNIAAFNDTSRDSYAGNHEGKGFVSGNGADILKVKAGITGNITGFNNQGKYAAIIPSKYDYDLFAKDSLESNLQFLTIHDGFTLWDKINSSVEAVEDGTTYEEKVAKKVAAFKQATAMLFTSQGKVIIHGGMEIARTKPLASAKDSEPHRVNQNDKNIVVDTKDTTPLKNKFHENSYRSVDDTNKFRWDRKDREPYKGIYEYTKGLIELKRGIPLLRMETANEIKKNLTFIGEVEEEIESAGYTSWDEVPELTIVFRGIDMLDLDEDGILYPVGEIAEIVDKVVVKDGAFQIKLTKEDLETINYTAWGDADSLNFKFQTISGDWDLTYPQAPNVVIDLNKIGEKNLMLVEFADTTRDVKVTAVSNHVSFDTVPELTVYFINAPDHSKGKTVWMMGEVYPSETIMTMDAGTKPTKDEIIAYYGADSNWAKGIELDENGNGKFVFSKEDITNFNLGAWGNGGDIDFALISTAGIDDKWPESYSGMGKNVIKVGNIEEDNSITIDLSIVDHAPGEGAGSLFVAYILKDASEEYIVVHNAEDHLIKIEDAMIEGSLEDGDWIVLLDSDEANINGVSNVDAGITVVDGEITVPANTSIILKKQ
ncbi:MAG: hypothetical protein GX287_04200 [Fusobacteria bacterium]|nr:hypothetical protein [Fusobacteriota bacterium]